MMKKDGVKPSQITPESLMDFHGALERYFDERYPDLDFRYPSDCEEAVVCVAPLPDGPALMVSEAKCIECHMEHYDLDYEAASDYFYYNTVGCANQPGSQPVIFVDTIEDIRSGKA